MSFAEHGFKKILLSSFLASFFALGLFRGGVLADTTGFKACEVKVLLTRDVEFDAVILDEDIVRLLEKQDTPDLRDIDPSRRLVLYYIQGLNGTMTVTFREVASIQRIQLLEEQALDRFRSGIRKRIATLVEKEKIRLERLKKEREARRKKEAAAAAKAAEAAREALKRRKAAEIRVDDLPWIQRYPPEKGWGPEKKQALYRRSMVIGVFPNAEERSFLDHYDEWTEEFEVWKQRKAETEKRLKEEAASEGKKGTAEESGKESVNPAADKGAEGGKEHKEKKEEENPPSQGANKKGGT